ncbi:MAG: hypothetical protein E7172_03380 [Firmicutes bacterium]|nr:hypothetical protein [Bacillota bacterium]
MFEEFKKKELMRIEREYKGYESILSIKDLLGDNNSDPSWLFFIQMKLYGYLLKNDVNKTVSELGVKLRRAIHPVIEKEAPKHLMNPHVIENRKFLLSDEVDATKVEKDDPVILPKEPVIWVINHGFKDDALASVATIPRHTYLFFGSIPQYYNSIYGLSAYLGGVVLNNRKVKASRKISIEKAVRVLECGADILIAPEGLWNKTPELLMLDFWPGVYKIAKKKGAKVVPLVHYLRDPFTRFNPIHTVMDDPINIADYSEEEALEILRNKMASWYYLMMEKYGRITRRELLGDKTFAEAWKEYLERIISEVDFYDSEIECTYDYRPKTKVRIEDVFAAIAEADVTLENVQHVSYAKNLVRERKKTDYQRLY